MNAVCDCEASYLQPYFKTPTDVLRLAVALSDGDISLAENTKFISFKTKHRKILLSLLENCKNIAEEMKKYHHRWLRLGERLHPSKYKKFENVNEAFDKLRNSKIITWRGELNEAFDLKDYEKVVKMLSTRSGEFARELDHVVRKSENKALVIHEFKKVSDNVSTTVLLQVKNHFKYRERERFIIKKGSSFIYKLPDHTNDIEEKYCDRIVDICNAALINNYKQLDYLGNVYLSEELKNFTVPFNQRSASKAMKTLTTGSKISIDKNVDFIRMFIWWTNTTNIAKQNIRVDVDLSVAILKDNFDYLSHISYTNLKEMNCYHSGDIVDGGPVNGDGVAEFIDVDINAILKNGGRYVVCGIYNYSNIYFSDMENIKFGWQSRQSSNSGEIFEPKTVSQRIDLSSKSCRNTPVVFDCEKRMFMWLDLDFNLISSNAYSQYLANNLENTIYDISSVTRLLTSHKKANLYDLIELHIKARGERVYNKKDADVVFDTNDGITPFDIDTIVGMYL